MPLYDTLGPDAVQYIIGHAEVTIVFASGLKLRALVKPLQQSKGQVTAVIYWGEQDAIAISVSSAQSSFTSRPDIDCISACPPWQLNRFLACSVNATALCPYARKLIQRRITPTKRHNAKRSRKQVRGPTIAAATLHGNRRVVHGC